MCAQPCQYRMEYILPLKIINGNGLTMLPNPAHHRIVNSNFQRPLRPLRTIPHVKLHQVFGRIVQRKVEEIEGNHSAETGSQSAKKIAGLMVTRQQVSHFQQSSVALQIKL